MKGATFATATKRAEGTAAAQGERAPASSLVIHRTIRTIFIAVVLERRLARQRRQTAWPDAAAQAAARRYCAAARTQTRSSTQRAGARALWSGGSRADQQGEQQTNKAAGSVATATTKRGGDERERKGVWPPWQCHASAIEVWPPQLCAEEERERKERNSLTGEGKLTSKRGREGRSGGGGWLVTNRRFHPKRASSKESCRQHGSRVRGLVF